ncbi:putative reverse transcriptase domain-containing protein [Tanacetum coccineum]
MKNHESRPSGSTPFSEANAVTYNQSGSRGRGSDHGRGCGYGRGRGQWHGIGRGNYHGFQSGNTSGYKKWQDKGKMIKNDGGEKAKGTIENGCYRCGSVNHWARACHTPKHLVEPYQRSQKNKGKGVEVNLAYQDDKIDNFDIDSFGIDSFGVDNIGVPKDQNDTTHLHVSDFLTNE